MNRKMINLICPHCNNSFNSLLEEGMNIVNCDLDQGGCDAYFVVRMIIEFMYEVFELVKVG